MKKCIITTLASLAFSMPILAEQVSVVLKEKSSDKYQTINVDRSEIEALRNSGFYSSVEEDIWTQIPNTRPKSKKTSTVQLPVNKKKSQAVKSVSYEPNDPNYTNMYYWHDQDISFGSSEINKAVNKSIQKKRLRIAVIDGGFFEHQDMTWTDGYSFFSDWGFTPGQDFFSTEEDTFANGGCETGHGLAVSAIIGAKQNNEIGIAGVVDADIVPIRAFSCNMAKYSTVAESIRYAAGEKVGDAPVIDQVDIINISMGGELETCPTYLQEAIALANNKGIQIYVAAGNQGIDIEKIVPAKCDGVTVIGASNQQRVKTDFSNFGTHVDLMIAGYDVLSYNGEGNVGWWEGTSFATPLAVGVHALALQYNPELTHDEIVTHMKNTTDPMSEDIVSTEQDCSGKRCGAGLINANKLMDLVIAEMRGDLYSIKHALTQESECEQQLFLSSLGNAERLCQLYQVVFKPSGEAFEHNIQVVRVAKGNALIDTNAELIIETRESIVLLDDIDIQAYDYGVKFCTAASCENQSIISLETSAAEKPAICVND